MIDILAYLGCWLIGVFVGLLIARSHANSECGIRNAELDNVPDMYNPINGEKRETVEICGATWYRIS